MRIEIKQLQPWEVECDALLVGVVEGEGGQPPWTVMVNRAMGGGIADRLRAGDLQGKVGEVMPHAAGADVRAQRVLTTGLGKPEQCTDETLRRAMGAAIRWLEARGGGTVATLLPMGLGRRATVDQVGAVAEAAVMAAFRSPAFGERAMKDDRSKSVGRLIIVEPRRGKLAPLEAAARRGQVLGEGANHARRLAELPANHLTPRAMASEARKLLRGTSIKVTVHNEQWMESRGMGALLGVAQGSHEPPRFIIMEHKPRRPRRHLILVGKGITFDTGGISLKPRAGMEKMKYDMCGAAGVIGTMYAVGKLSPQDRITGLVPTAENMPGGGAIKPGDVVISAAGKSVEVLNTDAEGRLILADALDYGQRQRPDAMIDMATLTGACKIALGDVACGAMGTDDALLDALKRAGEASGERAWPLPLLPAHDRLVRGTVADLRNSVGGGGGALTAAAFLRPFAADVPWAHLDIAGVAWIDSDRHYLKKGAAGFGVRLLARYLGL